MSSTLTTRQVRRLEQRLARRHRAASDPRGLQRGDVVRISLDINVPSERGAGGAGRHLVKRRPAIVWNPGGAERRLEVVPLSSQRSSMPVATGWMLTASGDELRLRSRIVPRLVAVPPERAAEAIRIGQVDTATEHVVARLIEDGAIGDLRAATGELVARWDVCAGRRVWRADAALAELTERRRRRIASYRWQGPSSRS